MVGSLASCEYIKQEEDTEDKGEPLARVHDRYLYKSDLNEIIPEDLKGNDSITFVQNYINSWAKNQLILYKAEFNLSDEQKDFEEQIEVYRNDLLKFAYQQEYISQKLDTAISDAEIEEYYQANTSNFQLKENILKPRYVVINTEAPKLSQAKKWFRSSNPKDAERIRDYSHTYAVRSVLADTSWVTFDKLASLIPIETYNQRDFLTKNKFVEITKGDRIYLLEIIAYKIKESNSPLPYVRGIIKNILLNKRKLDLLEKLQENLYEDAIRKKEFETY